MKLAAGIRKYGFMKWYERQLLRSHAHMALTFVCLIGVLAAAETASKHDNWAEQLIDIIAILACGSTGLWSLRRYFHLLLNAEATAHQANCPACQTYGRFRLVRSDALEEQVLVCCRKCSHEWTIHS